MKILFLWIIFLLVTTANAFSQEAPNVANFSPFAANTAEAGKIGSVPVNIFTGVPVVNVPVYNYSSANNGLSWGISLNYYAGGTQVLEAVSSVGLGWFLNATSVISRTVRGMPDDIPSSGYLYASTIPADFRSNGDNYYNDYLDAQQDVFQFSINGHSGTFFIGKDHQIHTIPFSNLKITYTTATANGLINAFKIVAEDGIKYEFSKTEKSKISNLVNTKSGYANIQYNSAWYLSKIISAFYTDTIFFNYTQTVNTSGTTYPQTAFQKISDGTVTNHYSPTADLTTDLTRINSVILPDKKIVSFLYTNDYVNSTSDSAISDIRISDTVLLQGYKLKYQNTATYPYVRLLLASITPYTLNGSKKGYKFYYNGPFLPTIATTWDITLNKRDHWGFYNGANNGTTVVPNVNGYSTGANRAPNFSFAKGSSLQSFYLPDGGYTFYEYELNDHFPYIKDPQSIIVQANSQAYTQDTISLNQVFGSLHLLAFNLDKDVARMTSVPISGTGNFTVNIKSPDGSVLYASTSFSLYDLFYKGLKTWSFNCPNDSFQLETMVSAGTSISVNFPININWENKVKDNSINATIAGGLRVKRIFRRSGIDETDASVEEYKYITEDGKSSGFLGDIPKYDYPYQETVINGNTTTTEYRAISSDPVNTLSYVDGSPVGYSRVEVINGNSTTNNGKVVYEFTTLADVNASLNTFSFPYAPQDIRSWGMGLPKTISVYDNNDYLVKKTVNSYNYDTALFINSNNKSLKLGMSAYEYHGTSSNPTMKVTTYVGQEYYPSSGRIYLSSTTDTLFHGNGSFNSSYKNYTYDSHYNISKVISSYNKSKSLELETRYYYPYDYTITGAIGKLRDSGIISTPVSMENWIVGDAYPRILSGNFTDYQNLSGRIKPLTTYALQSNAPVTQSVIGTFNSNVLNRSTTWFKPKTNFVSYDIKGNLLQTQDASSGQNSCVILDYNTTYPIAKIENASKSDVAYTSFEADGTGNWSVTGPARSNSVSITGKLSYNLAIGNITKALTNSTTYLLTVWGYTNASIYTNGVALTNPIAQQNGWSLYSKLLSGVTNVTLTGTGIIDELRIHPKDANMVSYTYEPGLGLITSTTDPNNTITYNEYDVLNRLKFVKDKDRNILSRNDYSDIVTVITPNWQPHSKECRSGVDGVYDSLYMDINQSSFSYGQTKVTYSGTDYCSCPAIPHPEYQVINGNCEKGMKVVSSTVKVHCSSGCTWVWLCTYHYEWSNGSVSANYTYYNETPCPLGPENGLYKQY